MVCPKCNHKQIFDFAICPKCGNNLNEESNINCITICPSCSANINNDDVFCPKCGIKLSILEIPQKNPPEILNDSSHDEIDYSLWPLQPMLYGIAIFFLVLPAIFRINFFLIAFIEVGVWVLLLLTQTELLSKYNFISKQFNLRKIITHGLKGKAVLVGIIIFEICLLCLSFITSESYRLNKFHQEVQTLVQGNNKTELNELFRSELKDSSNESIMYIINQAIIRSNKPFLDSIVSDFGILPDAIQDSVVKIFTGLKLQIYTSDYLASRLLSSDFHLNKAESKVTAMISKTDLEIEVTKQLYTKLNNTSSVEENIRVIDRTIQSIRDYFRTPNDSIWASIQLKSAEIDSLVKYSNKSIDMPDKPVYHKPTFDAPTYINGVSMPYDGDGLWVIDGSKSYVITGASRDPVPYFSGHVTKTDQTTSIYYSGNGYTYDATICEYVSEEEYNESLSSFRQEQVEAASDYKEEMKEYNASVISYKTYLKNVPIIKIKIINLFNSINLSINQLTGKI